MKSKDPLHIIAALVLLTVLFVQMKDQDVETIQVYDRMEVVDAEVLSLHEKQNTTELHKALRP